MGAGLLANVIATVWFVMKILIFIRIMVSYIPQFERGHPLVDILDMLTGPVLAPFRRLSMGRGASGGTIDFSPLFAIITLDLVIGIVVGYVAKLPF
jgi:uncharacterized protein YggT (Ycf19 family)